MPYTSLLGTSDSLLGNIILGSSPSTSLTNPYDSILGEDYTRLGRVILGHVPYVNDRFYDTLTLTEDLDPPHRFYETLVLVETLSFENPYSATIVDTLHFTESIFVQQTIQTVLDHLVFTEYASGIKGSYHPQSISQNLSLAETVRVDVTGIYAFSNALVFDETISPAHSTYHKSLSQTLTFAQTVSSQRDIPRSFVQTLTLAETITPQRLHIVKIKDKLNFVENIHRNIIAGRTIHNDLVFLDPIPITINYNNIIYVHNIQYVVTHQNQTICCQI